jgi:hypothetical protein
MLVFAHILHASACDCMCATLLTIAAQGISFGLCGDSSRDVWYSLARPRYIVYVFFGKLFQYNHKNDVSEPSKARINAVLLRARD